MINILKNIFGRARNIGGEIIYNGESRIRPYLSYATHEEIIIKGRVLRRKIEYDTTDNNVWDNFLNNVKSFTTVEAKRATVIIEYQDDVFETQTDRDGYFRLKIPNLQEPSEGKYVEWSSAVVTAPDFKDPEGNILKDKVNVMLPHSRTEFIIVSDIDDTVLVTNVNSFLKLRLLYNTFFKNESTRKPFEGISEVLHELTVNKENQQVNPIFYLSNSPWNLYNLLQNFLKFNDLPLGPLFLRDIGIKFGESKRVFREHKRINLEKLLNDFPETPLVLIGDATEKDADIYMEIFEKYPGRIKHIYIRADDDENNNRILATMDANPHIPLHLIKHSSDILAIRELEKMM